MSLTEKVYDYKIRIARESDADEIYYLVQRAFSSYNAKGKTLYRMRLLMMSSLT